MILSLLFGCSGYRFTQQDNPLSQYGIHSLSVPMFYNYSSYPEVSGDFTREMYRVLINFSGLKLYNGYSSSSDAVLIGILRSPEKETLRPTSLRVAKESAPQSVGGSRGDFYVPGTSAVFLTLQIIVIKKPTEEDLALLKSGIGEKVTANSKVIFNEIVAVSSQFNREVLDGAGTQVIATQNAGTQRKSVKNMAEQAAVSVRDLIFYAF